jgi:hypothetical protein
LLDGRQLLLGEFVDLLFVGLVFSAFCPYLFSKFSKRIFGLFAGSSPFRIPVICCASGAPTKFGNTSLTHRFAKLFAKFCFFLLEWSYLFPETMDGPAVSLFLSRSNPFEQGFDLLITN